MKRKILRRSKAGEQKRIRIKTAKDIAYGTRIPTLKVLAVFHKVAEFLKLDDCDIVRIEGFGDFVRYLTAARVLPMRIKNSPRKPGDIVGGNVRIKFYASQRMKRWLDDRSDVTRYRGPNKALVGRYRKRLEKRAAGKDIDDWAL
jgi:hypothetical protein